MATREKAADRERASKQVINSFCMSIMLFEAFVASDQQARLNGINARIVNMSASLYAFYSRYFCMVIGIYAVK